MIDTGSVHTPAKVLPSRTEVLTLEPGRELDGLVAEHVIGFLRTIYRGNTVYESPEYQRLTPTQTLTYLGGLYSLSGEIVGLNSPKIPAYSTDLRIALQILDLQKEKIFSKRQRFLRELSQLVVTEKGQVIAWPDALLYLEPSQICKAALLSLIPA